MNARKVACGLGWFSVGLGLTEVLAGRTLGRELGVEDSSGILRLFGLREIAAGAGILVQGGSPRGRLAPWVWARVAGDALDLAALSKGLAPGRRRRGAVAAAIGVVAAITAIDVACAMQLSHDEDRRRVRM